MPQLEIIDQRAREYMEKRVKDEEARAAAVLLVPRAIKGLEDIRGEWPVNEAQGYRERARDDLITICGLIDKLCNKLCDEDEEEDL